MSMYVDDSTYTSATTATEMTAHLKELSWAKHIDIKVSRLGRRFAIIKSCSAFLTALSTRQVLQALVLSHLDYCSVMWSDATKRDL